MRKLVAPVLFGFFTTLGCGTPAKEKAQPTPEQKVAVTDDKAKDNKEPKEEPKDKTSPKPKPKKDKKPKEDQNLNKEDRKAYLAALNEARKLHIAKDYEGAISSFDKALALFPDDPRALSEKGWAEFFAKKYTEAEANTRKAIGRTTDKNLLGSSYYNLGRIQEDQSKNEDAIKSYKESLKVRPGNKTVKERLTKLNASLVEKPPFEGIALEGPFASMEELCKKVGETVELNTEPDEGTIPECAPPEEGSKDSEELVQRTLSASGPYEEVRLTHYYMSWMETFYFLTIKTKEGYFLAKDVSYVYNPGAFGIFEDLSVDDFKIQDVIPGGAPEILLQFTHNRRDSDMGINEVQTDSNTEMMVCGIGASGKPSCISPIMVAESGERGILIEDEEADAGIKHEGFFKFAWKFDWLFTPEGQLQIKGKATKDMSEEEKALIGTHNLTFP